MAERDVLPHDFHTWPLELQRSYLRHPRFGRRCACRRYALLGLDVRDDYGLHGRHCCQPNREVID